jgi:hypothetical protein
MAPSLARHRQPFVLRSARALSQKRRQPRSPATSAAATFLWATVHRCASTPACLCASPSARATTCSEQIVLARVSLVLTLISRSFNVGNYEVIESSRLTHTLNWFCLRVYHDGLNSSTRCIYSWFHFALCSTYYLFQYSLLHPTPSPDPHPCCSPT